jgi:NAD(P)H-flavin reductase
MVAGGTGVAPFLALLEEIERAWHDSRTIRRVHLVHGARFAWSLYAGARLSHFAQYPWFTATETVSDDPTFPGYRGLVGDVAASVVMPGPYDALVCGSPLMVSHTTAALTASARTPESIFFEEFAITSEPPVEATTVGRPTR